MQKLHSSFYERGLEILVFPCNQFLSQEPQGAEIIETCIRPKYGLGFNVSYHFTDVVQFVSGDTIVVFDPHGQSLPNGPRGCAACQSW